MPNRLHKIRYNILLCDETIGMRALGRRPASRIRLLIFILTVILMLTMVQSAPHSGSGLALTFYPEQCVCSFFERSYYENLHLVSETKGSRTFYVTSDNLLAGAVMESGYCREVSSLGQQVSAAVNQNPCIQSWR